LRLPNQENSENAMNRTLYRKAAAGVRDVRLWLDTGCKRPK
jgi:hypothetical protein